jgi:hypothetical protein
MIGLRNSIESTRHYISLFLRQNHNCKCSQILPNLTHNLISLRSSTLYVILDVDPSASLSAYSSAKGLLDGLTSSDLHKSGQYTNTVRYLGLTLTLN